MIRKTTLAAVIIGGLALGAAGSSLFQFLWAPDRAAAYEAVFRSECLTRLNLRAEGQDPYSDLGKDDHVVLHQDKTALEVTQSRHKCAVTDSPALFTKAERNAATQRIQHLVSAEFPELTWPGDEMPNWDYFWSRARYPARSPLANWGIIVLRPEGDSRDALQTTSTTLALPRS